MESGVPLFSFFFFNDTATTEIYTLSLHDALPISKFSACTTGRRVSNYAGRSLPTGLGAAPGLMFRSEEHTSELQSQSNLVCRLLLEKKKNTRDNHFAMSRTHRLSLHQSTCQVSEQ